jgi:hypothetical protein
MAIANWFTVSLDMKKLVFGIYTGVGLAKIETSCGSIVDDVCNERYGPAPI